MPELTKGQQKLADEVAGMLAEAALPPDMKEQMLANLANLSEQSLVQLVRWLSDRNLAVQELEHELVELQKKHDADWKALEKEQKAIAESVVEEEIRAVTAKAGVDTLLASVDEE